MVTVVAVTGETAVEELAGLLRDSPGMSLKTLRHAEPEAIKEIAPDYLMISVAELRGNSGWLQEVSPMTGLVVVSTGDEKTTLSSGLTDVEGSEDGRGMENLTPRQQQVLGLVAKGLSTSEIAHALKITEKTVRNHISNMFQRLGVENRVQAARVALKRGLVSLDDE